MPVALVDVHEIQSVQSALENFGLSDKIAKIEFVDMSVDELLRSLLPFDKDYIVVFGKGNVDNFSIHVTNSSYYFVGLVQKRKKIAHECGVNTGNVQANLKASSFNAWCKAESNMFMGKKK